MAQPLSSLDFNITELTVASSPWNNLPAKYLEKLCASVPKRISAGWLCFIELIFSVVCSQFTNKKKIHGIFQSIITEFFLESDLNLCTVL